MANFCSTAIGGKGGKQFVDVVIVGIVAYSMPMLVTVVMVLICGLWFVVVSEVNE